MVFFLLVVGVYLIRAGILAGWDILTMGLGIAFGGGAILGTPPLRIFVKLAVNRVSGKHVFQVEQSNISDSKVIGTARDVHIYEAAKTAAPEALPTFERGREREDWEVDEEFTLGPDDYREFEFELEAGDELAGHVEAEDSVSCYVLGRLSFRSFEDGENFNAYWENEDVTRTKVSFIAEAARTYFLVVYRDADEDEDVSVSLKLRVES